MRIIDADGHVAEGASLAVEAMQRWPEHITPRADGRALVIEGRNYPEADGPGAGCPREHGLSTAAGIDYSSADGVLGDADRDQIDTMVLYPSLGLCAPTLEDPEFAAGFARLYNQWIADYCATSNGRLRGIAVTPIEHGDVAIDVMREAKDLGLVATTSRRRSRPATSTIPISTGSMLPPSNSTCRWAFTAHPACIFPRSASTALRITFRCTASAFRSTR